MSLVLETAPTFAIADINKEHRNLLFTDRPWIVVIHDALESQLDAFSAQEEIAEKLELGRLLDRYEQAFVHGSFWHNDGTILTPLANMHTTYGYGSGTVYLASTATDLDQSPRVSQGEAEIVEFAEAISRSGKQRQPVIRVPIKPGVSVIWREVAPTEHLADTAHAVTAESGRTSVVSEYYL